MKIMMWPSVRNKLENPYNALLSEALQADGVTVNEFKPRSSITESFDILHIHWPDALLKNVSVWKGAVRLFFLTLLLVFVTRVRKKPVVWTVHNIRPHGGASGLLMWWLRRVLDHTVTLQIHLNSFTAEALREGGFRSPAQHRVIPHGRYGRLYEGLRPVEDVRRELGAVGKPLLGFVGNVSLYKGILEFMDAAESIQENLSIVVAGKFESESLRASVDMKAANFECITVEDSWLERWRVADLIAACDLVVYPYRSILNSGSVMLPMEHGTKVLVPSAPAIEELSAAVGAGWVLTYAGALTPDELQRAITVKPPRSPDLSLFEWSRLAEETRRAYELALRSDKCA